MGQGPRERHELLLTGGQARAALQQRFLVTLRQRFDVLRQVSVRRRSADLSLRHAFVAQANILGDRSREQARVLEHHSELGPQGFRGPVPDVAPAN